jgi:small subunit ribosomal protein S8
MSMTDPISDFLARIRNGIRARKREVECPRSGIKLRIAEILRDEGYIDGVSDMQDNLQGRLAVVLRYDNNNQAAITGMRRISRPGQRKYLNAKSLPKVRNGLGIAIISTSRGVLTDREARKLGVGGEVICEVW